MLIYVHIQKSPTLGRKPTNAEFMLPTDRKPIMCLLCAYCEFNQNRSTLRKNPTNAEFDSYK